MGWTGILYWLLSRRLRSSWPLLAITSFGILAAVTLMAVGAIYSRALAEGGVRHTLATADPAVLDAQLIVQNRPLGLADYRKLRAEIEEIAEVRVGHMTREVQRFGRTEANWFLVPSSDGPLPAHVIEMNVPLSVVGRPFFLTGFKQHSRVVAGRWPEAAPVFDAGALRLEAVVGEEAASHYPLAVGSQLSLFPFRTDETVRVVVTVVGWVEPIDQREEYWLNSSGYFTVENRGSEEMLVPLYVPEEAFFGGLGREYPAAAGDFGWLLFFDTREVTAGTAGPTKDALIGLEADINKRFPRTFVFSGLKNRLIDYQKELTLARVPLYLFIGLVVLVILYFLVLVMGLLARYRADEASLLRSRGASVLQVNGFLVAAEGVVALIAIAAGPFLALAIVRYLLLDTINPVGVDDIGLTVGLSADMFVMGAIGGLLGLAVLAAYSVGRARQGVAGSLSQRARPPSMTFLHRYYIDLLVLAALGLLWWQIGGRGGFVSRDVTSRALEVDPSLLFGPVMVLLAVAVLVLRFLPWLVRLLAWGMSRVSPAWAALSLVRLARDPLPHGSLVIILMLAAAVGVFGASFQSTLARSQKEQALFRQGGDIVLRGLTFELSTQEAVANTPDVDAASVMTRDSVVLLDGLPGASSTLVRFDPDTLPRASWFREDFAGKSLVDLLAPLRRKQPQALVPLLDPASGIIIPVGGERLGLWVNVSNLPVGTAGQGLNLWARLLDSTGRYKNLLLGALLNQPPPGASSGDLPAQPGGSADGWVYLEATLPNLGRQPEVQFSVVSLVISKQTFSAIKPGSISLDDLTVKGPSLPAMGTVIEDYGEPGPWLVLPTLAEDQDTVEYLAEAARTGTSGLRYSWRTPLRGAGRGIFLSSGPFPLPAIGSGGFQTGQVIRFKAGNQVASVSIRDVTDYFPTVTSSSRPFLLVAEEDYRQYVERLFQGSLEQPREMWVSPEQDADRQEVISSLIEHLPSFVLVQDRSAKVELAERNPLAGGGWNGLTILALTTITVSVVLTLAIHGLVAVRTGRVDLTVARALGFSNFQLFLALALERVLVAALGIGIGSVVGIWLGRWVLGFLDITSRGQPVIPPMLIDVQGWLVGVVLACLVGATLLSLVLAALWARRLKVAEVLRAGE